MRFFSSIIFPQAPENNIWFIQNFFENLRRWCTTGINVTSGKFVTGTTGVIDTSDEFATSVNNTGGKFASGVNYTRDKKMGTISDCLFHILNLLPTTPTPVVHRAVNIYAKFQKKIKHPFLDTQELGEK
jgi:hypothetical protein